MAELSKKVLMVYFPGLVAEAKWWVGGVWVVEIKNKSKLSQLELGFA